ncbi:MAG: 4-hydroxythreonine-4-phosphate dehydrogenase PdxA [Bacteroidales bacterium]
MMTEKIKIGITQGDINGISYEVIVKTFLDARMLDICTPIVYGSPKVAAFYRKQLNAESLVFNLIRNPQEAIPKRVNIVNVMNEDVRVELGQVTEIAGQGAVNALKIAVQDLKNEKLDALVTAPFNKQAVQLTDYNFSGHTAFLAECFSAPNKLMLMINDRLRIGVVTEHIPLSQVVKQLSKEQIIKKIMQLNATLVRDFRIQKPRIAVLGLNPHNSDGGIMGNEEQNIIIPAIEDVAKKGVLAFGPYAVDGLFGSQNIEKFDAVLAMYHDQGLTPFKTIAHQTGVNFTAGLPIVRTSPAHGTAFDIAGKNQASPDSMRASIYLACDVYNARKEYAELTKNPLPYISKSKANNRD